FERSHELDVEGRVEARREPRLDAHLGGAESMRLLRSADDLLRTEEVRFVAAFRPGKGAESAGLDAHVREIDVSVDHVADVVSRLLPAHGVCDGEERVELATIDPCEAQPVEDRELPTFQAALEDTSQLSGDFVEDPLEDHDETS